MGKLKQSSQQQSVTVKVITMPIDIEAVRIATKTLKKVEADAQKSLQPLIAAVKPILEQNEKALNALEPTITQAAKMTAILSRDISRTTKNLKDALPRKYEQFLNQCPPHSGKTSAISEKMLEIARENFIKIEDIISPLKDMIDSYPALIDMTTQTEILKAIDYELKASQEVVTSVFLQFYERPGISKVEGRMEQLSNSLVQASGDIHVKAETVIIIHNNNKSVPAGIDLQIVMDMLDEIGPNDCAKHLQASRGNIVTAPSESIDKAKSAVESAIKIGLASKGRIGLSSDNLTSLWKKFTTMLNEEGFFSTQEEEKHATNIFRRLNGCVQGIAEIRNALGSDHGRGIATQDVSSSVAELTYNAALTVIIFVLRFEKPLMNKP